MLKLFRILEKRERRIFSFVVAVMLLMGVTQLVGIGALFPFITLLADPDQLQQNGLLSRAYDAFGFESSRSFLVFVGGLSGSIIGTALIFYLSAKELIEFKLLF